MFCIFVTLGCSAQNKIANKYQDLLSSYYNYVELNNENSQDVLVFIDYLFLSASPDIIKDYYAQLNKKQINGVIIKSETENDPTLFVALSKGAKDGYLYINRMTYNFMTRNSDIKYVINSDTLKSVSDVKHLINIQRNQLISLDTVNNNTNNLIIIKIK